MTTHNVRYIMQDGMLSQKIMLICYHYSSMALLHLRIESVSVVIQAANIAFPIRTFA